MRSQSQNKVDAGRCYAVAVVLMVAIAEARAQQQTPATATHRQIVVSIPDRKLALLEDGRALKVYPVAVGATGSPSPTGTFKVVNRISEPTYYHTGIVIPPGAENPLGSRWIGLDRKGYGIHGTNQPGTIGHAASHGCIRMARTDLEELFKMVRVGDAVEIHGEHDEALNAIFSTDLVLTAQSNLQTGNGGQF
ncbi:MAG: L,D-transpeptidase [Acidobacteria bacterium]|nr:L,D-transpeptidase [Acidobacteriaceae bacterium]MBV9608900.1 L,D-transpeptidase [Acidobacteriota bacterium]